MEGNIRRTKSRRFEIVPKGAKRGRPLCSGDDIEIRINGVWLPTRIAFDDTRAAIMQWASPVQSLLAARRERRRDDELSMLPL